LIAFASILFNRWKSNKRKGCKCKISFYFLDEWPFHPFHLFFMLAFYAGKSKAKKEKTAN
jgi:hypothetical protein